jgi:hypothetical protein
LEGVADAGLSSARADDRKNTPPKTAKVRTETKAKRITAGLWFDQCRIAEV